MRRRQPRGGALSANLSVRQPASQPGKPTAIELGWEQDRLPASWAQKDPVGDSRGPAIPSRTTRHATQRRAAQRTVGTLEVMGKGKNWRARSPPREVARVSTTPACSEPGDVRRQ